MSTLFEKLGGAAAVNAAVNIFYHKVLSDDSISHFFESVNMEAQHAMQKSFLTMAFAGPNNYTGEYMRKAHAPLVAKGLNEDHFNAVAGHLQTTLEELNVSDELISEVMAIVGSTKDDVLNR